MRLKEMAPGVPHQRNSADEQADCEETVLNLISHCFREWPNAVGFDAPEEHRGPETLKVQGKIPDWCAGTLFRTGPGLSQVETKSKGTYRVSHWFDGFGHSHRFDIVPPQSPGAAVGVTYSSRRQAQELMNCIHESGTHNGVTFAQRADPCIGLLGKCIALFNRPTGHNIHVVVNPNLPDFEHINKYSLPARAGHRAAAQNLWLTTDASVALQVDPNTLEPIGLVHQSELHRDLSGPLSAAHGQRDPETGDWFSFNTSIGYAATHRIFRLCADTGNTEILATIRDGDPVPAPASYVHSIFLTRNFVILCLPVARYRKGGFQIPLERNILDAMAPFNESDVCRWFVVDRRHGRGLVARFKTPAAFFFHSVNAFEEWQDYDDDDDGSIVIHADVVEYPNHDIIRAFYYDNLLNRDSAAERFFSPETGHPFTVQPQLVRWSLRLGQPDRPLDPNSDVMMPAAAVVRILGPHVGELPTINNDYATRRTRFVYSGAARGLSGVMMDSIVKTDMEERTALFWTGPSGHSPGEPIFVARPAKSGGTGEEDDGALLSVVLDGHAGSSYLLCLDAKTMKELGRAECGFAVPFGFHGAHVMPA